jgi:HlyD family secretion protein
VHFTVDAYPDDLFEGRVYQVRLNPTTTQNVVTYTVVVETPNTELKLLPGMTASLSFQIDQHDTILRIPNAALRFYPKTEQVHPDDRALLDGGDKVADDSATTTAELSPSAIEKATAGRSRHRRHVWMVEGEFLRAVPVEVGLSDNNDTELVTGSLTEGQPLVTGVKPAGSTEP